MTAWIYVAAGAVCSVAAIACGIRVLLWSFEQIAEAERGL